MRGVAFGISIRTVVIFIALLAGCPASSLWGPLSFRPSFFSFFSSSSSSSRSSSFSSHHPEDDHDHNEFGPTESDPYLLHNGYYDEDLPYIPELHELVGRYKRAKDKGNDEFDAKVQTRNWVNEDLRTFDKYASQICWGGMDSPELVFGKDIWIDQESGNSNKVGDKLCLYDGDGHPETDCKKVYCDRGFETCVRITGWNVLYDKLMTVVGCSKDGVEQCYLEGKAKRRGETFGKSLGGPVGEIWNGNPDKESELTACQCHEITVKEEEMEEELGYIPCNTNCTKFVKTCHPGGGH